MSIEIRRLTAANAAQIINCFNRVYGDSYANQLFYDVDALSESLDSGRLCSVGAFDGNQIVGHMGMSILEGAVSAELGNTVVDPSMRGQGIAWEIGAELTRWCIEKGYLGYLHYPTADHHIMQRQSVKSGFETGLMLGYIPAETDGKVQSDKPRLRGAATIVYEPLSNARPEMQNVLPTQFEQTLIELSGEIDLNRSWIKSQANDTSTPTQWNETSDEKRGLRRLSINRVGRDVSSIITGFTQYPEPCLQLDLLLDDQGIDAAISIAMDASFVFCGWLPGYRHVDVLRLQRVDKESTDFSPQLVNPVAKRLLKQLTM